MIAMFLAVFAASLLGSLHCAGMCGAFVAIAVGLPGENRRAPGAFAVQGVYHLGRLVSYALLGAAAGAAGSLVNLGGALAGMRTAAMALAGAAIATLGIMSLLRAGGVNVRRFHLPASWTRRVSRLSGAAMNRPPLVRAGMIGLLTTLLPCGWLYAFAVTAAGTGHPLYGALAMVAFWAGTLPALAAVGVGARKLAGPLGRKLPVVTAVAMVVVGGSMLFERSSLDPVAMARQVESASAPQTQTPACCVEKS
jgi:uncharacterized protein